jgi:hypothetical protein
MSLQLEIEQQIDAELALCTTTQTPYICAALQQPNNKLRHTIFTYVMEQKCTIGEAIVQLENLLDPNNYTE